MAGKTIKHYLFTMILGFLSVMPASHSYAMVFIESRPVQITPREQQLLDLKACQNKFNVESEKIVARSYAQSTPDHVYAEVLCKSRELFKNSPVHHVVYCERNAGEWRCERSEHAIRMSVGNFSLVYYADDVDTSIAYSIITKLASVKLFQGEPMPDLQKSVCSIKRFINFDNTLLPDVFVVVCGNREILVSTWCPQKECPRIITTHIIVMNLKTDTSYTFHAALYANPNFRILPINAA